MPSNLATLTRSHSAIASKKRAKREQLKEVLFDDNARREFLTGFHKRKMAKVENARKKALEREKQQRVEARREQRSELRKRAKENAAGIEAAYGGFIQDPEEEWTGILSGKGKEKAADVENEYEDEQILATVTVVEDFDPTERTIPANPHSQPARIEQPVPKKAPASSKPKKPKPKNIRYETKDARKAQRVKERARRTEKARLGSDKAKGKKRSRKAK